MINHPDGDEGANGVGDVVAAVSKTAEARRQDLQVLEQFRDRRTIAAEVWRRRGRGRRRKRRRRIKILKE